jgi:hypothetical protein
MTVHLCPRPFHRPSSVRLPGITDDGRENTEAKAIEIFGGHAGEECHHVFNAGFRRRGE